VAAEYETVAAFGSKCEITDLEAITAANHGPTTSAST
jgi:aldehyde:ferredoxin oxidoreductase